MNARVALVALLLLTACGTTSPGEGIVDVGGGDPQLPADTLVLRVSSSGGMLAPGALIGQVPRLSVYADGRAITEGPVPAIYPGPAMPNLQQAQLSPAQLRS
ncbi:MAG: hypothetical protein ACTHMZ_13555, partial [Actinomycetes bacterium]